uniref:Uncharacterized protein n=1 Tax=Helianthus annuus TaxID=4232 RepID=A0A251SN62_HELAN
MFCPQFARLKATIVRDFFCLLLNVGPLLSVCMYFSSVLKGQNEPVGYLSKQLHWVGLGQPWISFVRLLLINSCH